MPANPENFKLASETLQKTYGISAKEAEAMIKKGATEMGSVGGVSTKAVDKAVSNRLKASAPEAKNLLKDTKPTVEELSKLKEVAKAEPAAISAIENAGRKIGKYSAETWDKIKKLRSRLSLKQALLYGLAGYGAYELVKGLFSSDPKTNGVLPTCIANIPDVNFIVGTGDVVVAAIPDGVDAKSSGHGGLEFWPNGRAITKDRMVRGTYYCAGTSGGKETVKATVSEQETGDFSKYSNIHIDWDDETKKVTPVDPNPNPNPNPSPKKSIYHDCESKDFPLEFGCKSTKIKEMQKCLGLEAKYQTGNFGPLTKAKIGVDSITKELYDKTIVNCAGDEPVLRKPTGTVEKIPLKTITPANPTIDDSKLKMINTKLDMSKTPIGTFEDIKKRTDADGNLLLQGNVGKNQRIKYKGPDLSPEELAQLDKYYEINGYQKIKEKDKAYGEKYVWAKQ